MPSYRLISFYTCPFVQRAAIVLQHKGVAYDIEYVDLANKPEWFLKLSPLGKVPLLEVDGKDVLFESQVIAEYLEETEAPAMHPSSPLRRAQHRAYTEVVSSALGPSWRMTIVDSEAEATALAQTIRGLLRRLEDAHSGQTFFDGESLSLLDAAAAPLLQRLSWIEGVHDFGFFAELPKLAAWRDALLAHPAVVASTVPDVRERAVGAYRGWLGAQVATR